MTGVLRLINQARASRKPRRSPTARRRLLILPLLALAILAALAISFLLPEGGAGSSEPGVIVIPVDGIIDSRMAGYVTRNIAEAEKEPAQAVVLILDTPGGMDGPMRDIIKKMVNSPLPIIAYVYPSGGRAASAGTFIMMAADVAAMAPGTNLGAAHPVAIGADLSTEEGVKILNDAAAYMRSLAAANGRNVDWAELAVRQSISASAEEALSQGIIEFTSKDVEALLVDVDGYTTVAKGITLDTGNVTVREVEMSFWERTLHLLLNPNLVFFLLLVGLLAVAYEFAHPGIGLGAVTGFICLALAIYTLMVLPVNYAGLALIVIGFILLVADLFIMSLGLLSAGGVICIVLGSWMLFDSSAPFLRVSLPLSISLALVTAGFFVIIVRAAVQARRLPARTGSDAMIGEHALARTRLDPAGQVHIHGEIWSAETLAGETVERGEEVEVLEVSGLILKVRRLQ